MLKRHWPLNLFTYGANVVTNMKTKHLEIRSKQKLNMVWATHKQQTYTQSYIAKIHEKKMCIFKDLLLVQRYTWGSSAYMSIESLVKKTQDIHIQQTHKELHGNAYGTAQRLPCVKAREHHRTRTPSHQNTIAPEQQEKLLPTLAPNHSYISCIESALPWTVGLCTGC